jgi:RNA polymerase sigma factor (TIGR02999 family)
MRFSPMASEGDLTGLLRQAKGGDREAQAKVFEQVYDELRAAARRIGSGPGATLQPTALVHEAWLKLAPGLDAVNDRVHFFAVASLAMRQVVANHARAARREKRGGGLRAVSLDDSMHAEPGAQDRSPAADLCALDECLEELASLQPRHARLVELRVFGGLTVEEAAEELGVSSRTLDSDWVIARAWLLRRLSSSA